MAAFTMHVDGLKELDAKLGELGSGAAIKRVVRAGLVAGGQVVQAAIRERAPVRPALPSGTALPPGALAVDIELRFGRSEDGLPAVIVSPGKYTKIDAARVEYGHQLIKGGKMTYRRGVLLLQDSGGHVVKNIPAYPFIRPGFEASAAAAIEAVETGLKEQLEIEVAKR